MIKKLVSVLCLLSFTGLSLGLAVEGTIGGLFNDNVDKKIPVKVYIKEIINQSGKSQIAPEIFKKELIQSLHERRSLQFKVVDNPAESDIQMAIAIKNYQYLERGPLKPSIGVETTLLDAAATMSENYVEMAAECTVIDTKTEKVLWKNMINEYIKKTMTPEESVPLIYDVVARAFIWKCFGKANLKDSNSRSVM